MHDIQICMYTKMYDYCASTWSSLDSFYRHILCDFRTPLTYSEYFNQIHSSWYFFSSWVPVWFICFSSIRFSERARSFNVWRLRLHLLKECYTMFTRAHGVPRWYHGSSYVMKQSWWELHDSWNHSNKNTNSRCLTNLFFCSLVLLGFGIEQSRYKQNHSSMLLGLKLFSKQNSCCHYGNRHGNSMSP